MPAANNLNELIQYYKAITDDNNYPNLTSNLANLKNLLAGLLEIKANLIIKSFVNMKANTAKLKSYFIHETHYISLIDCIHYYQADPVTLDYQDDNNSNTSHNPPPETNNKMQQSSLNENQLQELKILINSLDEKLIQLNQSFNQPTDSNHTITNGIENTISELTSMINSLSTKIEEQNKNIADLSYLPQQFAQTISNIFAAKLDAKLKLLMSEEELIKYHYDMSEKIKSGNEILIKSLEINIDTITTKINEKTVKPFYNKISMLMLYSTGFFIILMMILSFASARLATNKFILAVQESMQKNQTTLNITEVQQKSKRKNN